MIKRIVLIVMLGSTVSMSYGAAQEEKDAGIKQVRQKVLRGLFRAIVEESPERVQERVDHLLSVGGDVNAYDETVPFDEKAALSRPTLLHFAAIQSVEKCRILVAAKADPNVSALGGFTPLHCAACAIRDNKDPKRSQELEDTFKFLIREGANPYLEWHRSNLRPRSPGWTSLAYLVDHPGLVGYAKNVSKTVRQAKAVHAERLRLEAEQQAYQDRLLAAQEDSSGLPLLELDADKKKPECVVQ